MKIMRLDPNSQLFLVQHVCALRPFTPEHGLLDRLLPQAEKLLPGGGYYLVLSTRDEKLVCDLALCALGKAGSEIFPRPVEAAVKFLAYLLSDTKFRAVLVPTDGHMTSQPSSVTEWSLAVTRK